MNEEDKEVRHRGGGLDGLRAEAADEAERERAGEQADASERAAATARSARLDFEARQKDQARADAAEDQARADREKADEEQYERLLTAENETRKQADEDARAAGRPTSEDLAAADRSAADDSDADADEAYPARRGTTAAADGTPYSASNEADAGSAGAQQVTQLPDGEYATADDAEPLRFEGTARVAREDDGTQAL